MKKLLLTIGFVSAALLAQAQKRVVASLGFEDSDEKYTTEYALTPNLGSIHGDWVNVQGGDDWTEKYSQDAHSGEYCFRANNSGNADAYNWDRGFKIGLSDVKLETPYRVSFWMKAAPTFIDADGNTQDTKITSWMSKGMENFDISLMAADKSEFGLNSVTGLTEQWQRFTFLVFNPSRELVKEVVDSRSWVGNANFPAEFGGNGETYKEFWGGEIPEMYFFIANMKSPVEYLLDDILVEENVAIKQVTFNMEAIKIDFGYKTNLADLAKKNNGTFSVDPSTAKVFLNGEEIEVEFVEGKEDGFLYIFPADAAFNENDDIRVSFSGDDRILYTSKVRPSADLEGDVVVFGCEDEPAYYEDFSVEAAAWSNPIIETSKPSNFEFGINGDELNEIVITFKSAVDISKASAVLALGATNTKVEMTLSEDGRTITIPVSGLKDGEYVLTITGLINALGLPSTEPTKLTFTVGEGGGGEEVVIAYKSDFENYDINTLPLGWSGHSDDPDDRIGSLTDSFSGAPRMMGTSDAPSHGIYIAQRGGSEGVMAFGKYAAMGAIGDQLPDGVTAAEALYLEAGEWQLSYRMATWQGSDPNKKYTTAIYNSLGEPIYEIPEQSPEYDVADAGAESVVKELVYEFTVAEDGFYYVEFVTHSGWGGLILTGMSVQSKPSSSAGYYKQLLEKAIEDAEAIAANAGDNYDGETKQAFVEALERAKTGTFTSPAAIEEMIDELNAKGAKLVARITSFKDFVNGFNNAKSKYEGLDAKYKQSTIAIEVEKVIAEYDAVDPNTLTDAELAEIASKVKSLSGQIDNVADIVNTITYQAQKAVELAMALNVFTPEFEAADALATDNSEVIDALNKQNTGAFYKEVSTNSYLDALLLEEVWYNSGDVPEEWPEDGTYNDDGYQRATTGVSLEAFIKNPKFYTTSTGGNFQSGTADLPGWTIEQGDPEAGQFNGTVHFSGDAASENKPVSNIMINNYGASDYRITQVIENLPAGVYDFRLDTRTVKSGDLLYNAQNEEGIWDKYIFAQVDDEAPVMAPFAIGGYQQVRVTVAKGIQVKEGSKVTIGVVENYTSGLAQKDGNPTTGWDTNTWVDDANLYFVAPLEGFDYAAAAEKLASDITTVNAQRNTVVGIYGINGAKATNLQKGINIVKLSDGNVKKVIVK